MKKIIIIVFIFMSIKNIGQHQQNIFYYHKDEVITYSRIDYTQYGIAHVYVSMYEQNEQNKYIKTEALNFLKEFSQLYHTLYFFIEIPSKYSFEEKENIFNEIMKEIEKKENIQKAYFYLNFDIDYSQKYQTEKIENNMENKVKRVSININQKNIKNGLLLNKNKVEKTTKKLNRKNKK